MQRSITMTQAPERPAPTLVTRGRTVTEADIVNYANFSGDFAPLHIDETYAEKSQFGTRIIHGVGVFAICNGLIVLDGLLDNHLAFLGCTFKLVNPTFPGDTIHCECSTKSVRTTSKGDREVVTYDVIGVNQRGDDVLVSEWTLLREKS
jgi:acyl dehydratase